MDLRKKFFFYDESSETLEQVVQRNCGCPIPESVQGLVGWGFEKPDAMKDVLAQGRGVELDDLQRSLLTQAIL